MLPSGPVLSEPQVWARFFLRSMLYGRLISLPSRNKPINKTNGLLGAKETKTTLTHHTEAIKSMPLHRTRTPPGGRKKTRYTARLLSPRRLGRPPWARLLLTAEGLDHANVGAPDSERLRRAPTRTAATPALRLAASRAGGYIRNPARQTGGRPRMDGRPTSGQNGFTAALSGL